jgi:hypothetical protein
MLSRALPCHAEAPGDTPEESAYPDIPFRGQIQGPRLDAGGRSLPTEDRKDAPTHEKAAESTLARSHRLP